VLVCGAQFVWDFGDQTPSLFDDSDKVLHTYTFTAWPGHFPTYTVTLKRTDASCENQYDTSSVTFVLSPVNNDAHVDACPDGGATFTPDSTSHTKTTWRNLDGFSDASGVWCGAKLIVQNAVDWLTGHYTVACSNLCDKTLLVTSEADDFTQANGLVKATCTKNLSATPTCDCCEPYLAKGQERKTENGYDYQMRWKIHVSKPTFALFSSDSRVVLKVALRIKKYIPFIGIPFWARAKANQASVNVTGPAWIGGADCRSCYQMEPQFLYSVSSNSSRAWFHDYVNPISVKSTDTLIAEFYVDHWASSSNGWEWTVTVTKAAGSCTGQI
jgi:hypothetical protein